MDRATRTVLYAGVHELLDQLVRAQPSLEPVDGVIAYICPRVGKEAQWQLAALTCDLVVIRRPDWDPVFEIWGPSLRSYCSEPDEPATEALHRPFKPSRGSRADQTTSTSADELLAHLDELLELDDTWQDESGEREEWADAVLTPALAWYLRFVANLAAVGASSEVVIVDPDMSASIAVVHSLKGVVFYKGEFYVHDDWVGPPLPTGVRRFEDVLQEIEIPWKELAGEVLGAYAAGPLLGHDRLPLVPSTTQSLVAAAQFFSRFRRLHFYQTWMNVGPQADVERVGPDWRPALMDRLLIGAFPDVTRAPLETFATLSDAPKLHEFRSRIRSDALRIEGASAAEIVATMREVQNDLQSLAAGAARVIDKELDCGRRRRTAAGAVGAIGVGIGFVTTGAAAVIGGALLGGSLAMAVERRALDPTAALSGAELCAYMLAPPRWTPMGKRTSRLRMSSLTTIGFWTMSDPSSWRLGATRATLPSACDR
jgi:hypothetical protein